MNSRQRRVTESRIKGREPPSIGIHEDVSDPLAKLGVENLAGHEYERGYIPAKAVSSHKQPCARMILQMEDAQRRIQKRLFVDLKQFIPGISLKDVLEHSVIMTSRALSCPQERRLGLSANERNFPRSPVIAFRCEKPHKAGLTDHPALIIIAFDADIVGIDLPVDPGPHVGFGHHNRRAFGQERLNFRRDDGWLIAAMEHETLGIAKHAKIVRKTHIRLLSRQCAVFRPTKINLAGTQKGEVLAGQPAKKIGGLPGYLAAKPIFGFDIRRSGKHEIAHGMEVCICDLHVGQRLMNGCENLLRAGIAHGPQMDLNIAFPKVGTIRLPCPVFGPARLYDRVKGNQNVCARSPAGSKHRAHEKRHVFADNIQHDPLMTAERCDPTQADEPLLRTSPITEPPERVYLIGKGPGIEPDGVISVYTRMNLSQYVHRLGANAALFIPGYAFRCLKQGFEGEFRSNISLRHGTLVSFCRDPIIALIQTAFALSCSARK